MNIKIQVQYQIPILFLAILLIFVSACNNTETDNKGIDLDKIKVIKNESLIDPNNSLISNINIVLNHPAKLKKLLAKVNLLQVTYLKL